MIIVTALAMLGVSTLGGSLLWTAHAAVEGWKRAKYLRWRNKWQLIKGGADE